MSDFEGLNDQQRLLLQVKLDGFAEAAILSARVQNIGLSEALCLSMSALLRECSAHGVPRERVTEIWTNAMEPIYPSPEAKILQRVN